MWIYLIGLCKSKLSSYAKQAAAGRDEIQTIKYKYYIIHINTLYT